MTLKPSDFGRLVLALEHDMEAYVKEGKGSSSVIAEQLELLTKIKALLTLRASVEFSVVVRVVSEV